MSVERATRWSGLLVGAATVAFMGGLLAHAAGPPAAAKGKPAPSASAAQAASAGAGEILRIALHLDADVRLATHAAPPRTDGAALARPARRPIDPPPPGALVRGRRGHSRWWFR